MGYDAERDPERLNFRTDSNFLQGRWQSLSAAMKGVVYVFRTQPNAWIELVAVAVVIIAGWWFKITPVEWAILGLTFAMILALEAINTAIEAVVDLISPEYHPLAKVAKDCAAGAMILAVLGSIVVAGWIFLPRLWEMIF